MKIVAGIDIGNASTETALARIENGKATFLSSGTVPTQPVIQLRKKAFRSNKMCFLCFVMERFVEKCFTRNIYFI